MHDIAERVHAAAAADASLC